SSELLALFNKCLANRLPAKKVVHGRSRHGQEWSVEATFLPIMSETDEIDRVLFVASDHSRVAAVHKSLQGEFQACSILSQSRSINDSWLSLLTTLCASFDF